MNHVPDFRASLEGKISLAFLIFSSDAEMSSILISSFLLCKICSSPNLADNGEFSAQLSGELIGSYFDSYLGSESACLNVGSNK